MYSVKESSVTLPSPFLVTENGHGNVPSPRCQMVAFLDGSIRRGMALLTSNRIAELGKFSDLGLNCKFSRTEGTNIYSNVYDNVLWQSRQLSIFFKGHSTSFNYCLLVKFYKNYQILPPRIPSKLLILGMEMTNIKLKTR